MALLSLMKGVDDLLPDLREIGIEKTVYLTGVPAGTEVRINDVTHRPGMDSYEKFPQLYKFTVSAYQGDIGRILLTLPTPLPISLSISLWNRKYEDIRFTTHCVVDEYVYFLEFNRFNDGGILAK